MLTDNEISKITAAIRCKFRLWRNEQDDLVQTGLLGALMAIDHYQPERGERLMFLKNKAFFAIWDWIRTQPSTQARNSPDRVDLRSLDTTLDLESIKNPRPLRDAVRCLQKRFDEDINTRQQLECLYRAVSDSDQLAIDTFLQVDQDMKAAGVVLGVTKGRMSQRFTRIRKVAHQMGLE